MSKQGPYIPFYSTDWLKAVGDLKPAEVGIYINIIMLIYDCGEPIKADFGRLSRRLNCPISTLQSIVISLCAMEKLIMRDGFISNDRCEKEIEKRNHKAACASASAQARWSERPIKTNTDNMRTHNECNANQNQNQNHIIDDKSSIAISEKSPLKKPTKGTRMQEDWEPTDQDVQHAFTKGLSNDATRDQAERFRDYWLSKAGAGGVKLDWAATWRNWVASYCERQAKGGGQRPTGHRQEPTSRADIAIQRVKASQGMGADWRT